MKENIYNIIRNQYKTEKSTAAIVKLNKYTFKVYSYVNKYEIKKAIEEIFNVKVLTVNTIILKTCKKKGNVFMKSIIGWKKVIVTLDKNSTINFFDFK
jgi:large subunit ribosomal protein L23